MGHVMDAVFVNLYPIRDFQQIVELNAEFVLAGCDLMMVLFGRDTHFLNYCEHFGAQISH